MQFILWFMVAMWAVSWVYLLYARMVAHRYAKKYNKKMEPLSAFEICCYIIFAPLAAMVFLRVNK